MRECPRCSSKKQVGPQASYWSAANLPNCGRIWRARPGDITQNGIGAQCYMVWCVYTHEHVGESELCCWLPSAVSADKVDAISCFSEA